MSQTTSIDIAEKAYLRWHKNEVANQKILARELSVSHSVINNLLNNKHPFSAVLKERYPNLQRSGPAPKLARPSRPTAVADIEAVEPEIDLALETLETLPGLNPAHAVVLAKTCFAELSELLQLITKPCPRLEKLLGNRSGRPKNEKTEKATRQAVDEEIQEGERLSEEFLKDK